MPPLAFCSITLRRLRRTLRARIRRGDCSLFHTAPGRRMRSRYRAENLIITPHSFYSWDCVGNCGTTFAACCRQAFRRPEILAPFLGQSKPPSEVPNVRRHYSVHLPYLYVRDPLFSSLSRYNVWRSTDTLDYSADAAARDVRRSRLRTLYSLKATRPNHLDPDALQNFISWDPIASTMA
jgi:hypothetical protein